MSAGVVDPCYCSERIPRPHTYGAGCPGNGLTQVAAEWLDRCNAGDPEAIAAMNRLLDSMFPEKSEPLLSDDEQRALNDQIREMERVRSEGAAKGAGYFIGGHGTTDAHATQTGGE